MASRRWQYRRRLFHRPMGRRRWRYRRLPGRIAPRRPSAAWRRHRLRGSGVRQCSPRPLTYRMPVHRRYRRSRPTRACPRTVHLPPRLAKRHRRFRLMAVPICLSADGVCRKERAHRKRRRHPLPVSQRFPPADPARFPLVRPAPARWPPGRLSPRPVWGGTGASVALLSAVTWDDCPVSPSGAKPAISVAWRRSSMAFLTSTRVPAAIRIRKTAIKNRNGSGMSSPRLVSIDAGHGFGPAQWLRHGRVLSEHIRNLFRQTRNSNFNRRYAAYRAGISVAASRTPPRRAPLARGTLTRI